MGVGTFLDIMSHHFSSSSLPEHGNEQVYKQDVGDQQINNQQNYYQPVTVLYSAWLLAILNQCHVVCASHIPRLPH